MASPFAAFRKNQKWLIATVGLMAIGAFVFLPIVSKIQETRQPQNRVVVTTTAFGDLRETDITALIRQRQLVRRFIGAVTDRGR